MKIDFEFDTQYGKFSDALYLPDDQVFSPEEIDTMKQQRLGNWLAVLTSQLTLTVTYTLIANNVYRGSDENLYTLDAGVYTGITL